eukprot:5835688-Alexandrium_andersonii.AAC.1
MVVVLVAGDEEVVDARADGAHDGAAVGVAEHQDAWVCHAAPAAQGPQGLVDGLEPGQGRLAEPVRGLAQQEGCPDRHAHG